MFKLNLLVQELNLRTKCAGRAAAPLVTYRSCRDGNVPAVAAAAAARPGDAADPPHRRDAIRPPGGLLQLVDQAVGISQSQN